MRDREPNLRRSETYELSVDERIAVRNGLEDARLGNFASDEEMEAFYQQALRQI